MQTSDVTGPAAQTISETLTKFGPDDKTGLTDAEVQVRLKNYRPNALAEKQKNAFARAEGPRVAHCTQIAPVFMCSQDWLVPALSWKIIGFVWAYNIAWMMGASRYKAWAVSGSGSCSLMGAIVFRTSAGAHAGQAKGCAIIKTEHHV